jgi:hypothetical protein
MEPVIQGCPFHLFLRLTLSPAQEVLKAATPRSGRMAPYPEKRAGSPNAVEGNVGFKGGLGTINKLPAKWGK